MKHKRTHDKQDRPFVKDDFIYNDPDRDEAPDPLTSPFLSETPEEAIRKLRSTSARTRSARQPAAAEKKEKETQSEPEESASKIYSTGISLDDDLQPVYHEKRRERKRHPLIRGLILALVTMMLLLTVAAYIFHRISPETPGLGAPENFISTVMTPVQTFFSSLTETFVGYFRSMKLRANLETEYNNLRAENEQLVYKAMLADELQHTLSQYEDLSDEIKANANMKPIVCTVIGRSDSNYFSTFTINKGLDDGVEDYMAVTISGALVGYTENVQQHTATVRTVIDSDASIAALIQSSRDQGTVRGTLGIDGTPLCRMYYLPDDNLPRPGDLVVTSGVGMSFPKGIPIGIVRESTRGMEANKQFIVLEPQVDFQHLEYVIVLRYKPKAEAIEGRENGRTNIELIPLESARPSPVIPEIAASLFETDAPDASPSPDLPTETPTVTDTPVPEDTPTPEPTDEGPVETPFEYQVVNPRGEPTPTPTPTSAPTATPYFTPDPDTMNFEED